MPQWPALGKVDLPNGLVCYLTSHVMRANAVALVKEIFRQRRYTRPGFELRPTDTVVDIGANIGLFALWAAPHVSRIISVEPAPATAECLKLNVALNALTSVTVVEKAVGGDGGVVELVTRPGLESLSHAAGYRQPFLVRLLFPPPGRGPRERYSVPTISLPRLLDDFGVERVDYLKVDCEGGEYEVFRHMDPRHWKLIDRVAMEFHEFTPEHRHGELVETLRENGFTVDVRKKPMQWAVARSGEIWARRA